MLKRFFSVFLMCLCVFATNINFAHGDTYECGTSGDDLCFFAENGGGFVLDSNYNGGDDEDKYLCQSTPNNYKRETVSTNYNGDALSGYKCSCSNTEYGLLGDDCVKCSDFHRTLMSGTNNTCGDCDENHGYVSDGRGGCKCKGDGKGNRGLDGWLWDSHTQQCTCTAGGYAYPEDGYCVQCAGDLQKGRTSESFSECVCKNTGYTTYFDEDTGAYTACKCNKTGYGLLDGVCKPCTGDQYTLNEAGEQSGVDSTCALKGGYTEDGKCDTSNGYAKHEEGGVTTCVKCEVRRNGLYGPGFVPNKEGTKCVCEADGYATVNNSCTKCSDNGVGWIANQDHNACICDGNNGYIEENGVCVCKKAGFGLDNNNECKSCSEMGPGLVSEEINGQNQCICGASGYGVKMINNTSVCTLCPLNSYSVTDDAEHVPNNQRICKTCGANTTSAVGSNGVGSCVAYTTGFCSFAGANTACNIGTYSSSGMECQTKTAAKFYFPIDADSTANMTNNTVDATKWLKRHVVNQGADVTTLNENMTDILIDFCNSNTTEIIPAQGIKGKQNIFAISNNSAKDIINILENYKNRKLSTETEKKYIDMWISYIDEYKDKSVRITRYVTCDIDRWDLEIYNIGQCLSCPAGKTTPGVGYGVCPSVSAIDQYCINNFCFSLQTPAITLGDMHKSVQASILEWEKAHNAQNAQSDESDD